MFNIVEKSKKPKIENQELFIGDVVITKDYRYLAVCDGYGHYSFINLDTGYLVSDEIARSPYCASCYNRYNYGDLLIPKKAESKIIDIISRDNVSINVELN